MNKYIIAFGLFLSIPRLALAENDKQKEISTKMPTSAELADNLVQLRSAVTKVEMDQAILKYSISKIVLIESHGGEYQKMLLTREGLAIKVESDQKVKVGHVKLINYGFICHYLLSTNLHDDRLQKDRVTIDNTIVELRIFFDDGSCHTLRCYYPRMPTYLWTVRLLVAGIKAETTWEPSDNYDAKDEKLWGKSENADVIQFENEIKDLIQDPRLNEKTIESKKNIPR